MLRTRIRQVMDWLKRVITQPRDELTRWQMAVRTSFDFARHGARQLRQDRAPQMAAALSFRTLFSLLPVLVVGTLLVRAIGGQDQFLQRMGEFFSSVGLDSVQVTSGESGEQSQTLSAWLLELVGDVQAINLAAVTWIGVAVLVYSALSLMVTIENSFNSICRAPEGRSWWRRLPIYWTVLTLGPAAIAITMYANARLETFVADGTEWWVGPLRLASVGWGFLVSWIVMFAFYKWIPNTTVVYRGAFIGAFVAAALLEIGKRTMGAYVNNAMSIEQLYGSLGLIPLFMFWVYLMWLVVLFGLEVTATIQMLGGRRLEEIEQRRERTGFVDPASILVVMESVARRFQTAQPSSPREISEATGLSESTVSVMLDNLVASGLLHRLEREDGAVSLARPPEQITADELMTIAYGLVEGTSAERPGTLAERLREAQQQVAARVSLAALVAGQAREG